MASKGKGSRQRVDFETQQLASRVKDVCSSREQCEHQDSRAWERNFEIRETISRLMDAQA